MLLSGTSNLHRAFLAADVDARLIVFDGLPHVFWFNPQLPESVEANKMMATFFVQQLQKSELDRRCCSYPPVAGEELLRT